MARSHLKRKERPTPIRLLFYKQELEKVEAVAREMNLDFSQALRVIINQHAAWIPYTKPVMPEPDETIEERLQHLVSK